MDKIEKLSADDQVFFKMVYETHERLIYKTARKYSHNDDEACVLAQDAVVKLIGHVGTLREIYKKDSDKVAGYIVRTIQSLAFNRYTHQKVVDKHILPESEEYPIEAHGGDAQAVERAVLSKERRNVIHKIWPKLREEEQHLLSLKYYFDLSDREASAELGMEERNLRQRKYRLLQKLRKLITKEGMDDEAQQ